MQTHTILVTGGTGLVGSYLKEYISALGAKDSHNWVFLSSKDCDLTCKEQVDACFERYRPTMVIHLAANVGGLYKNMRQPVELFHENILMNENVLSACHRYNVQRGIFCLSTCIFPESPSSYPITEEMLFESPPHSSNAGYAYAKRMLQLQCFNYRTQYGREYICLSPVNLFGRNDQFHLEDSHVIPGMIHRMYLSYRDHVPFISYGTGKPLRQFLYAGDFAAIIYKTLFEYRGTYEMMICASNVELSIGELENMIHLIFSRIYPGQTIEIQQDVSKSDGIYKKTASNDRLLTAFPDLTFQPLEPCLEDVVQWFVANYSTGLVRC